MTSHVGKVITWLVRKRVRTAFGKSNNDVLKFRKIFYKECSLLVKIPAKVIIRKSHKYGFPTTIITPNNNIELNNQIHILFLHGGGFVLPLQKGHLEFCSDLALRLNVCIHIPEYRLAPEFPFPIPVEDCFSYYSQMINDEKITGNIFLIGDSAGGALCLTTTSLALKANLKIPNALILISPLTGHLFTTKIDISEFSYDAMFTTETYEFFIKSYIGSNPDLNNYLITPIQGITSLFPPILITASKSEVLYEDALGLYEKGRSENVSVELHIEQELFHAYPLAKIIPEAKKARYAIELFIRKNFKTI